MIRYNDRRRSDEPELMDLPGVKQEEIYLALRELEKVNTFLGGYSVTMKGLNSITHDGPLHIIDYGCGGGDVLRYIYDEAKKNKYEYHCTGIDINPAMIQYCREKNGSRAIHFYQYSIWENELLGLPCDVAMNSLFCHHFDHKELVLLVKRMFAHAKKAVIINDLQRHPFAFHSIRLITKFFSQSYLVRNDAPLSVARSLSRTEWEEVIHEAGITDYLIEWKWAFRWLIILHKK